MQHNKPFLVRLLLVVSAEISPPGTFPSCGLCDTVVCWLFKLSENLFSASLTSCFFLLLLLHNEDILFPTGNASPSHCALHTESLQSLSLSSQNLSPDDFKISNFKLLLGFPCSDNQPGFKLSTFKTEVIYLYSLNSKLRLSSFCFYYWHHYFIYFLVDGKLLYNVVLVSDEQHHESFIIIYIYVCVCVCVYILLPS